MKPNGANSNNEKRRKVNPYGAIVTTDEAFETIRQAALEKEMKKTSKVKLFDKAPCKRKSTITSSRKSNQNKSDDEGAQVLEDEFTDSDESGADSDAGGEFDDSDSDDHPNLQARPVFPPTTEDEGYAYLKSVWDEINPPVKEKDLVGMYFGLIYYHDEKRKKSTLCWKDYSAISCR